MFQDVASGVGVAPRAEELEDALDPFAGRIDGELRNVVTALTEPHRGEQAVAEAELVVGRLEGAALRHVRVLGFSRAAIAEAPVLVDVVLAQVAEVADPGPIPEVLEGSRFVVVEDQLEGIA